MEESRDKRERKGMREREGDRKGTGRDQEEWWRGRGNQ